MPRSKEDDAARKREKRLARSADDAAARSADDAARKREGRSARSAARQHRFQHRPALEAATLGAAMTVAATVDDPVAVEAATLGAAMTVAATVDDSVAVETAKRVLQHPWGHRDSIMPRSKEGDVARKREERLARSADDAAARSADDAARNREECSARSADGAAARSADNAARKREDLLLRMALFNQAQNLKVRVWVNVYLQLFVYWTDGLGVVLRSYCAHSATKAYPGEIQTQKLLRHR